MARIGRQDQERLIKDWLPRVRMLPVRRRPIRIVMICVLVGALATCMLIVLAALWSKNGFSWSAHGPLAMVFLGFAAICFAYLGKLQACDDELLGIEAAVIKGDWDDLLKSLRRLSCYSGFKGILDDVKGLKPG